jgi:hypothetical protein
MAYSGTPEPTGFGERESGQILIVDIACAGAPPAITPVRTGRLEWVTVPGELREPGDLTRLREQLEGMANPDVTLIEVALSGLLTARERGELDRMEEILSSRFLWGRVDASRLRVSPADAAWIDNLPAGIIREAAMRLKNGKDVAPEVAARALMELYAIAAEVGR